MDIRIKALLIEEKERVVKMTPKKYKWDKKSRMKFLGKGGYSRVFLDRKTGGVIKMIKARKLKSRTSLSSIR